MKTRIIVAIVVVVSVLAVLAGIRTLQIRKMIAGAKAAGGPPPESVSIVQAERQQWENALTAIGSIRATQGVKISSEVAGTIVELHIESGRRVEKDAVLLQLDTSTEKAQLRAVEAQLDLAKINLQRVEKLRADNTVSVSELDSARSAVNTSQANADAIRAAIEKKTIRAPFPGILGLRQVDLGQYIDAGRFIVSLQALNTVYVDFSLPQQDLANLKTGMRVRVTTDTYPGKTFEGTLSAINPDLDPVTRSVPLRGSLDNPDHLLRPGMFAKVEVVLPTQEEVVAVPATAILSAPYGDSVFIIETKTSEPAKEAARADSKTAATETAKSAGPATVVRQQFIRTGRNRGDFVAVTSGLKGGERIVSPGLFKLRNGMAVVESNAATPEPSMAPRPSDS